MIRIEFLAGEDRPVVSNRHLEIHVTMHAEQGLATVAPRCEPAHHQHAVGIDQLSYNAARHRKTIRSDSA